MSLSGTSPKSMMWPRNHDRVRVGAQPEAVQGYSVDRHTKKDWAAGAVGVPVLREGCGRQMARDTC